MNQFSGRKPKLTKTTVVYNQLRQDIMTGALAPKERLQMELLKKRYKVGFSPLREALSRLMASGFVKNEEQCGYAVTALSFEDFNDLYNIRMRLEDLALTMAIEQGDDQWESEVVAVWYRYAKLLDPKGNKALTPELWGTLHNEFRSTLVKACNSHWLLTVRNLLHDQASRYRYLCLKNNDNVAIRRTLLRINDQLVEAVLKRNIPKALSLSQQSWKKSINLIASRLRELEKQK